MSKSILQEVFVEVHHAMMKTAVMMIGEFEYDSIFFGQTLAQLPYKPLTLVFFLAFLIIMPIIIMNLLVTIKMIFLDVISYRMVHKAIGFI